MLLSKVLNTNETVELSVDRFATVFIQKKQISGKLIETNVRPLT